MDGRPIISAPSLFSLRVLEKNANRFTKLSHQERLRKRERKQRTHRHQEEFVLDSVSVRWCPFPAIPLIDLQHHYKSGITRWVLRLFPPALQQRKGGSFSQNALAWGRAHGKNQREQDPKELCLPLKLAPAARPSNAHGKYANWEVSAGCGSTYAPDYYFLHKHLNKISEGVCCCQWRSFGLPWMWTVMWTQCKQQNETGAVQSHFDLIYILGAFRAFTWPSLGIYHMSLVLLLAVMWSPWVHFRRIKFSDCN